MRRGVVGVVVVACLGTTLGLACGRLKPQALAVDAGTGAGDDALATSDLPAPNEAGNEAPDEAPDDLTTAEIAGPPPRTGRPLPADVSPHVRLLGQDAILLGNDKTGCTYQTPPSGDGHRWCAFSFTAMNGLRDLWVIDVTRSLAGDVPVCDGTSSGCLRLTTTMAATTATFFEGDTLIYHSDPVSGPNEEFLGPIYAWRPGWAAGRQISSGRGFTCIGNARSSFAACLDDPVGDPVKRDGAHVRMSDLGDPQGGLLAPLGVWPLRNDNDQAWKADFSPDGARFVLSSAPTIGAPQALQVWSTSDPLPVTPPAPVIEDLAYWTVSNDSQKIYFYRSLPPTAQLTIADFPAGGGEQLVDTNVVDYVLLGDRPEDQAVLLRKKQARGGTVALLRDRSTTTAKTLLSYDGIFDGAFLSKDLSHTVWLDASFNGVVVRNDDLTTCAINVGTDPSVSDPAFLADASLLFWKEHVPGDGSRLDAYLAPPDRCRSQQRFAQNIDFFTPIGAAGLLLGDERDTLTGLSTLKYVARVPGDVVLDPRGAVRVQEGVKAPVVLIATGPAGGGAPLVIYRAEGASAETTGWFVFGPLPLSP
jgi:hypothetical protein